VIRDLQTLFLLLLAAGFLMRCTVDADPAAEDQATDASVDANSSPPVDGSSVSACRPPSDQQGRPRTVAEAVALVNALAQPLTLTCFLQALGRPLHLNATSSPFSAQPADGENSPRIFIMNGPLIMSVTLGPEGRNLLEFSEMQANGRTIKAELPFPVVSEVSAEAPYDNLMFNDGQTRCAICHADERPVFEVNGVTAFESIPFRPHDDSIVDMLRVVELQQDCDSEEDAERCSMLQALVGSPFVEEPFPREFLTMFR
jgi:hypothetical protein